MLVGSKVDYDISNLYIPKDGKRDIDYQKSFSAILTIIVKDKDGKIVKRYKQKSHSPTSNFIGIMLPATYYSTTGNNWTYTTTSNSTFSYAMTMKNTYFGLVYTNLASGIPSTVSDYLINILVGSGSNSNPYSTYNLASPIANGSGVGQLVYNVPNIPNGIIINGNQAYFIISQSYNNQSSETINISEVGILVNLYASNVGYSTYYNGQVLTWYDVLSSPISVSSGQQLIIYYTFSVNA
jgi:hypothetical protein